MIWRYYTIISEAIASIQCKRYGKIMLGHLAICKLEVIQTQLRDLDKIINSDKDFSIKIKYDGGVATWETVSPPHSLLGIKSYSIMC